MKELIKSSKEFKIIPTNFKSSSTFELISLTNTEIIINLKEIKTEELKDYKINSTVEVFAVNPKGLLYFETEILNVNKNIITLKMTSEYSLIQRREYSRVKMDQGSVIFKDLAPDIVVNIKDISAGGIKFISRESLEIGKYYDIQIKLSNNMIINCAFSPIRVNTDTISNTKEYIISGKFVNLENTDRIILVQYAFKTKLENQNKEDE